MILSALHSTGLPDHVELPIACCAITDGFIGVAKAHGEYLARAEGCPPKKVFVVPNGVDINRFQPQSPDEALREQLGLPPHAPVAAIVAALRPEKNHELFLRSAALVRKQVPDAHFLVIGDGAQQPKLEELTRTLDMTDAVHFLGTRSDVQALLSLSDVLVLSSHMEANPVSILEALACGKPVVATRVGSIPETVHDGENGYLVPAGDAEQMAGRVAHLLADRQLATQMGLAGRELVVRDWSLDRMVSGYQDLIRDITSRSALDQPWRRTACVRVHVRRLAGRGSPTAGSGRAQLTSDVFSGCSVPCPTLGWAVIPTPRKTLPHKRGNRTGI